MSSRVRRLLRAGLAWDPGRQSALTRALDRLGADLQSVCRNEEHDVDRNGEAWLLRRVGQAYPRAILFDVGANHGSWAECARREIPEAYVHCFELSPATFAHLQRNPRLATGTTLNAFGLGDCAGPVRFNQVTGLDVLTSVHPVLCAPASQVTVADGRMERGDDYCARLSVPEIHLLKCDVEGGEPEVLAGFEGMLSAGRIAAVQFEYGRVNLVRRFLLADFYALLGRHGYVVGKLYPGRIAWKTYELDDEDFVGPNYVAMRPSAIAACRLDDSG